jgi:group I intron endonuclease
VIIYKITNKINGLSYIGQTTKTFEERYNGSGHWWVCTGNAHLKNSASKYGHDKFVIEILEKDIKTIKELDRLEILYIKKFNTLHPNGYNFCSGGGHRDYCQEICDKISESHRRGKIYKFKNPNGEIVKVKNLARFCKENNLSRTMMVSLFRKDKRYKQHKGWTLPETSLKEKKYISPEGKLIILKERELRPFCRKNNLHHYCMIEVWKGSQKKHKGWIKA